MILQTLLLQTHSTAPTGPSTRPLRLRLLRLHLRALRLEKKQKVEAAKNMASSLNASFLFDTTSRSGSHAWRGQTKLIVIANNIPCVWARGV